MLELSAGRSLAARRQRAEVEADGSWTWSGTIDGEPLSSATFVRMGGVVQGSIRSSAGAFSLEPLGDGPDHVLRQIDSGLTPPELPPLVPPVAGRPGADLMVSADDDDREIDLFVVYTAAARQQAGGNDLAVKARIALGVAEANTAFVNSGLAQRLRLVGAELIGYRESGDLSTDLQRLTAKADGFIDQVHERRRAVGADLVTLVAGSVAGRACGVAWVMRPVSLTFAPYAFSVTAYTCISPNYTFGHELAHNMGAAHAPEDPNTLPAIPYAYGYKDPDQAFRTVMAYDCPAGCPRVLHFSNPTVTYDGKPTGTAALHNNALALSQAAATVANFGASRAAETLLGAPGPPRLDTHGTAVMLSWDPPAVGMPSGYLVEVGTDEGFADVATFALGPSETSFVRTEVPPGSYWVRVRAVDASGPGAPSSSVSLRMSDTGRCLIPVSQPTLQPATVQGGIVTLAWTSPATGHPVDRYFVGVGTRPQSLDAAVIDTGSTDLTLTTAAGPGVYFVRVAGLNACGVGAASNEIGVVVGPQVPGPPTGLLAGISMDRVVTLSWQPSSAGGAPTEYVIEAGEAPGLSNVAVLPTASSMTSFVIAAPPGRYYVRVRALNAHGSSLPSAEIELVVV